MFKKTNKNVTGNVTGNVTRQTSQAAHNSPSSVTSNINKGNNSKSFFVIPGMIIMYLDYIFPREWGKKKNTSGSARRWKDRDILAPYYSAAFYAIVFFVLIFMFGGLLFQK